MLRSIKFKNAYLLSLLTLSGLTQLSGCSHLNMPAAKETLAPEAVEMKSGFVNARLSTPVEEAPTYSSMDAQTMYQLMIAEMLITHGQFQDAFDLMIPIAQKRREPEITQRVFQLSMQTMNLLSMKQATTLLKEVEPDKAVTWQAAYLLSLQEGELEAAFKEWQRYVKLADAEMRAKSAIDEDSVTSKLSQQQTFESLVLDTANRVAQSSAAEYGLAFLKEIQKQYPQERVVGYALGAAALAYQDYSVALTSLWASEKSYQGVEDKTVIYEDIYTKLAQAYLGATSYEEGLNKLAGYAAQNPNIWRFQEQYARLEVKAERYESAVQRYSMIVEQFPQAYTSRLSLALLLMEQKQFPQADDLLNPLLNVPSFQSISLYYSGVSKKSQNQPEQALLFFKQIVEGEFYIEAQLQIAELEYPKIGLTKVLEQLETLNAEDPEDQLKLYRAKAIFYKAADNIPQAIQNYELALNIMPSNIDILFSQAALFYETADYQSYEDRLNRVLALKPNQVDALNALGYYFVEQNIHLDKAEDLLAKAVAIAPDAYYVLDSQGWLRYMQARYSEAEVLLEKAMALKTDEEVLMHLIKTKWQLSKFSEAQGLWDKYAPQFPENEDLQSLMRNLSKN
ncbi:tetratricopeptide repeat protein [Thiosulfativibrio zosterae]|uniref:Uncharacterized protein n=1 Tax=Thiosulfativibrio zosterae TaxID=2675053 RepID=A0A6F8PQ33_9GAMM|nr:hypothetical protein [Thiosulfativibrio zosterae]BBP44215.1 hypothetical protein THMIRHAT_19610 [Thiosulfativibrio zosterae]